MTGALVVEVANPHEGMELFDPGLIRGSWS